MSESRPPLAPPPQAQSSSSHRRPNMKYRGTNGFFDRALTLPEETPLAAKDDNLMQIDNIPDEATRKLEKRRRDRKLWDAIERHREADEVLDARGEFWPG